nr:lymphocyte antigen 6D-like [Solea senegalensis]
MKILLLTLLVVLLCSTQVLTLRCYTCEGDSENCKAETECLPTDYCKTVVGGNTMRRGCAARCVPNDVTYCCQENLCES